MLNIAVLGYGYWGPNLVRNFASLPDVRLKTVCDSDVKSLEKAQSRHPEIETTTDCDEVFQDESIDAIVIALPAELHGEFARQALVSGKHVFVEKPLAMTVAEAKDLVQLSEENGQILMVGHLLLYHPAVERLKKLIDLGELGPLFYLYSQRVNLGVVRSRENALWSLAPHDVSVLLYLLDELPYAVSATGASYLQEGIEDTVFVHLKFSEKKMAHIHVSWLDPHKVRKITVVGQKKMAVFDDVEPVEKIKVFDRSIEPPAAYSNYGEALTMRFGDIYIPHIEMAEPLRLECRHFIDSILSGQQPRTDAARGLEVVRVLEAAHRSLKEGGEEIQIAGEAADGL
ncbi:MAG: Gfo/Idh/MocA family oxidoreductase [bacterium]